jgi:hypothetical protein
MMTPDRRAKMAELAEAMQGVLDANEHYRNVRDLPGNTDRLRADTDAELTAAAERLDAAMIAWIQDHSTTCDGNGRLQLIDENKCDKF